MILGDSECSGPSAGYRYERCILTPAGTKIANPKTVTAEHKTLKLQNHELCKTVNIEAQTLDTMETIGVRAWGFSAL